MHRQLATALLALAAALPAGHTSAQELPLVITGGQYFDVTTGTMRTNAGIVSVGGRLMAVGELPTHLDLEGAR